VPRPRACRRRPIDLGQHARGYQLIGREVEKRGL
jgi:hypothetical protein